MAKRQITKNKTEETTKVKKEVITPKPNKAVTSKSGKAGAKNTAPKKVNNNEVVALPTSKKEPVKKKTTARTPKKVVSNVNEDTKQVPVAQRVGPAKTKNISDANYIRIPSDADIEKFKEMSQRIQNGSLQWAYFAIDGDKGYHYYLVLK